MGNIEDEVVRQSDQPIADWFKRNSPYPKLGRMWEVAAGEDRWSESELERRHGNFPWVVLESSLRLQAALRDGDRVSESNIDGIVETLLALDDRRDQMRAILEMYPLPDEELTTQLGQELKARMNRRSAPGR